MPTGENPQKHVTAKPVISWRWAITQSNLGPTTRLVLHTLSVHMSESGGRCFPSVATIARESGAGERTVKKHIAVAREAGWLVIRRVVYTYADGGHASNTYQAAMPSNFDPAPSEGVEALHAPRGVGASDAGGRGRKLQGYVHDVPPNSTGNSTENSTNGREREGAHAGSADAQLSTQKRSASGKKKSAVTIDTFIENCKERGELAVPADDPVFEYARSAGIQTEHLQLAWCEFRQRMRDSGKRYKDFRAAFRNYIRGGYLKLWFIDSETSESKLNSAGRQAWNVHNGGEK